MELKTFISTTLLSIVEGIKDAQQPAEQCGAHVNPGGLTRPSQRISDNSLWDAATNNFARVVSFDIAVTVEEGSSTGAKIGVVAGLLSLGANGASESKQQAISRIKFDVPVLLPVSHAPQDARQKKPQAKRTVLSKGLADESFTRKW